MAVEYHATSTEAKRCHGTGPAMRSKPKCPVSVVPQILVPHAGPVKTKKVVGNGMKNPAAWAILMSPPTLGADVGCKSGLS